MFTFFRQRIYVQLVVVLMLGIAAGYHFTLPAALLLSEVVLLVLCVVALAALWRLLEASHVRWANLVGMLLLVLVGYLHTSIVISLPLKSELRQYAGAGPVELTGRIVTIPKYQRGHLRFMLAANSIAEPARKDQTPAQLEGLCYVFLRTESATELCFQDTVTLYTELSEADTALNQGAFDYRNYLLMRGTVLTAYVTQAGNARRQGASVWPWPQLSRLRAFLTGNLDGALPGEMGKLAVSVVYGDKITDLPEDLRERFRRAGLMHILVASGTQVSLLIVLLGLLFLRFSDDFTWRGALLKLGQFAVTMLGVMVYATVTGFETSILRALVMGCLVLIGRLVYRDADGLTVLAQAALIILLVNPLKLFEAGFLLSFGATFGLIYVCGVGFPLVSHLHGAKGWTLRALLTTAGAQLFVAPMLACLFSQLSLWGLVSNMLAIPLAFGLLVVGGVSSLGLGLIPGLGWLLNKLLWVLTWGLNKVAELFSALPGSDLAVPAPPWWWLLAAYTLIFVVGEWIKARQELSPRYKLQLLYSTSLLSLVLVSGVLWQAWVPRPGLSAFALPVAEAYLWQSYPGEKLLFVRQAGLERSHNADNLLSALRSRGVNRLDGIIWLDEAPDDNAGLMAGPLIKLGSPLPQGVDQAWLGGTEPWGVACGLGPQQVWVIWDDPDSTELPGLAAPVRIVMNSRTWDSLAKTQRYQLQALAEEVYVVAAVGGSPSWPGVEFLATELGLRPVGDELCKAIYRPVRVSE